MDQKRDQHLFILFIHQISANSYMERDIAIFVFQEEGSRRRMMHDQSAYFETGMASRKGKWGVIILFLHVVCFGRQFGNKGVDNLWLLADRCKMERSVPKFIEKNEFLWSQFLD